MAEPFWFFRIVVMAFVCNGASRVFERARFYFDRRGCGILHMLA
jgi:hypothetical protein